MDMKGRKFPKPIIVVSKCLEFAPCRWNGISISSETVRKLKEHVCFIEVCPEVEIGLGIPREPIRLIIKEKKICLVQNSTGLDFTEKMNMFSESFLNGQKNVDGFILKDRSPSCGFRDVKLYPARGKVSSISSKESGLFGKTILKLFPGYAIESEGRLNNFTIREHFLARIFGIAKFREQFASPSMKKLVEFQTENKLLFMAYNQTVMRELGRIVANHEKKSIVQCVEEYKVLLLQLLGKTPRYSSHINVLMHAFGYFSKKINSSEKKYFLESLERFRSRVLPLSVPVEILRLWISRFDEKYLAGQSYFMPYPQELVEITDSGKGVNR